MILYLPRVFGALLIVIVGAWLVSVLADLSRAKSARSAHIEYAVTLGSGGHVAVLFFTFAMALDFLGVSFPFLTIAFAILLGGVTLAAALAFGLGGRGIRRPMLAGASCAPYSDSVIT